MYAVIQTGGKQYRVAPGDTIRTEWVDGKVGEKVSFGAVLAVHTDDKKVVLGADAGKASVSGKIVSQGRGKKLTVLKFKKGNQYKISRGHRQNYTAVQVGDIKLYLFTFRWASTRRFFLKRITSCHIRKAAAPLQTAAIRTATGWASRASAGHSSTPARVWGAIA